MKRKLLIFLSIISAMILTVSISACGIIADTDTDDNQQSSGEDDSGSSGGSQSGSSSTDSVSFEAVTIADDNNLTIKFESYEEDYLWGPAFKVYLENKTSDVTLMFSISDAAVNGIMCDPLWAKELSSGLKTYSYVYFSSLEDNGINYIETVEIAVRVYNSDDWLADDFYNETVTLSVQNNSSKASTFTVTSQNGFAEKELVNKSGVMVKVIDFDEDYLLGPRFIVYIENSTDKTLMVTADDVGVNGFSCDPYWATEVWADKAKYSSMYWFDSTLTNNNIDSIQTVSFTLRAYDSDNWLADDIINISVKIDV